MIGACLCLSRGAALTAVVAATAACVSVSLFAVLDADPVLFAWDLWWNRRQRGGRLVGASEATERVWIIGASSGIGEELAYQLASEDSSSFPPLHLILSSRSEAKLLSVAQTCRDMSSSGVKSIRQTTVTVLPLDVCDDEALHRAVQEISASSGGAPLDTVVLNAGGGHLSPALETTSETALAVWRLNAHWPMVLVPLLFRHQLLQGVQEEGEQEEALQCRRQRRLGPHLVVTSSVAGVLPVPLSATYAAAKHALQGYFRSLAAERPDLCLHIIMPGPVATNFHRNYPTTATHSNNPIVHKHTTTTTSNRKVNSNKLQMPVERCVRLVRTALRCFPNQSRESWIAAQPVLTALVLHQFVPYAWMHHLVYRRIGPRRLELYRAGYDLYDPASWRRRTTTTTPVNGVAVPTEKTLPPPSSQLSARSTESSDRRDENVT